MAKVLGLGGLFLKSKDPGATQAWYADVLGLEPNDYGGFHFLHRDSATAFPEGARTIFSMFDADTDYFEPSNEPYMLNLIVDDLDGILAAAASKGVEEAKPRESHPYGRFGWVMDPDGRKVELWQPIEPPVDA
ncbi:MAG: VOC family protein [Pseudomonadota bacterium]